MVATPTSRARFIKQGYQDNPESWGGELNTGALDRIDDARGQWVTKALTGDYTLDVQNYIQDEARAPMLRFTGTGGGTVTAPAVSYWYIVRNDCSTAINMKPSGGTASEIRAGVTCIWHTDGSTGYTIDPTLDKIKTAAANVALGGYKLTGVGTGTNATDAATLSNKIHEFAAPTSALAMNNQKITGVGTATSTNDAATLANKVHEFAAPTSALAMNSQKITGLAAGAVGTDAATLNNRLDQFAAPTGSVSMGNQRITNLAAGVSSTDAASLSNKVHEFAAPTSALPMNGQKITGIGAATVPTDAASLANRLDQFAAPTNSVPFNSQKITGLGSGSAATDAANIGDVQAAITAAATINLPTVTGNGGRYLTTDGTTASWSEVDWAASVDVASASTANIGAAASNRVRITGTTTITSFGTSANKTRMVLFAGALTLTHNATTLILPTGANITTAAGDVALCVSDGSGNWRVISYMRADGKPVGTINTALLDNDAVTYAKMQNVSAASRLLGRGSSGGSGDVEEITLGTGLSMSGTTISASGGFTLGTAVATTSGTAFDFTGIPSTARMIVVSFDDVSLSGTDNLLVQIGPSGGVATSGYTSNSGDFNGASASSTSGFIIFGNISTNLLRGALYINLMNASTNFWVSSHSMIYGGTPNFGAGTVALSGTLTQLRVTRTGTNTFDAGNLNIAYI